jgi:hypothetical protein
MAFFQQLDKNQLNSLADSTWSKYRP